MSESKPNAVERLQVRTAWIADYGSASDKMEELYIERARLCEALKQARLLAQRNGHTMREFAGQIGITPTQLSAWTDEIPSREPDATQRREYSPLD